MTCSRVTDGNPKNIVDCFARLDIVQGLHVNPRSAGYHIGIAGYGWRFHASKIHLWPTRAIDSRWPQRLEVAFFDALTSNTHASKYPACVRL